MSSFEVLTYNWKGLQQKISATRYLTGNAICFTKTINAKIINTSYDTSGRIAILETIIDDQKFILINLYNANTENDQLSVLATLNTLLENHDLDGDCHPIFGGDFNLIFDILLDADGGNPSIKKKIISKTSQYYREVRCL